ncbi:hypothetical protein IFM47457_07263 [Aspergillus lentulus]|nr:hypothetical protein IFM47457_07263 [Aspergillus lentulus]
MELTVDSSYRYCRVEVVMSPSLDNALNFASATRNAPPSLTEAVVEALRSRPLYSRLHLISIHGAYIEYTKIPRYA